MSAGFQLALFNENLRQAKYAVPKIAPPWARAKPPTNIHAKTLTS